MKSRRILAMILVLAFVFAFMAMSASAVMPRAACPQCGSLEGTHYTSLLDSYTTTESVCETVSGYHMHLHRQYQDTFICKSCSHTYSTAPYWRETCKG